MIILFDQEHATCRLCLPECVGVCVGVICQLSPVSGAFLSANTVCLCVFSAPLRYSTMTIIWICMALLSGLVTFVAIIICRKRQGYTLPHYPSLLCVEHFLTLLPCLSLCNVACDQNPMCTVLSLLFPHVVLAASKMKKKGSNLSKNLNICSEILGKDLI